MNNPFFSIICPVHNAETTIDTAVGSVLLQSYQKWELILVDDGSADKSGLICDDYASKHSNIRVIHKANAGQARARFDGVFEAKGSYILFLDSDDEYAPDALAFLDNQIKEKQNDVIVYNAISIDSKGNQDGVYVLNLDKLSSPLVECFCKRRIGYLWSICFKSGILKKVDKSVLEKFFTLRYSEDYYLIYNILKNIKTEQFQMIDEKLYIYKTNSLSITNNQNASKLMDRFIATNCVLEDMFKNYPSEYKQLSIEEKETAGWTYLSAARKVALEYGDTDYLNAIKVIRASFLFKHLGDFKKDRYNLIANVLLKLKMFKSFKKYVVKNERKSK